MIMMMQYAMNDNTLAERAPPSNFNQDRKMNMQNQGNTVAHEIPCKCFAPSSYFFCQASETKIPR